MRTTNERPLILMDLDGVLFDFLGGLYRRVRELAAERGVMVQIPEVQLGWDLMTGHADTDKLIRVVLVEDGLFDSLDPIAGSIEAIAALREEADVLFASTPMVGNRTCSMDKASSLIRHHGAGSETELILTYDKTVLFGHVLVDDKHGITGHNPHPVWTQIAHETPYNAGRGLVSFPQWDADAVELVLDTARRQQFELTR